MNIHIFKDDSVYLYRYIWYHTKDPIWVLLEGLGMDNLVSWLNAEWPNMEQQNVKQPNIEFYNIERLIIKWPNVKLLQHQTPECQLRQNVKCLL
jgi:hypothetical protein